MAKNNEESVPPPMKQVYESIVRLTDDFCQTCLDEEYAQLCRAMAAELSGHRPSPLSHGRIEIWACAIVYALGRINFLFDKAVTPHMKPDELCGAFNAKQSTVSAKAGKILDMLDTMMLDPRWTLPSKLDSNPMAWYILVDGINHRCPLSATGGTGGGVSSGPDSIHPGGATSTGLVACNNDLTSFLARDLIMMRL